MPPQRFALASTRIVTPTGVRGGAVLINGDRIEAILPRNEVPAGTPIEDLGGLVISPGIIDTHVHINEPGRTDWEGFATATRAAAAGGVTTLIDMPLNSSPVTTSVAALEAKRQAATGKCWVDVGFYGGVVPGNLAEIQPLIDAGVCGLKAFMCDSGLPEFPASGEPVLRAVLPILAQRNVPLLVHAELIPLPRREGATEHGQPEVARAQGGSPSQSESGEGLPNDADPEAQSNVPSLRNYNDWLNSRPESFEREAITLLRQLCAEFHAPIHVVHLASGPLTSHFFWAKQDGLPLTVETCPHYLHFYAERLAGADPRFKCAPPIRRKEDRQRLWEALIEGVIDTIGSDHSPCPPDMKHLDASRTDGGDWQQAWGGTSSLELTLPIVWRGLRAHMVPFHRLTQWLSLNPARLVGLADRKGQIAAGFDADLCVWNHEQEWTVAGAQLQHRHKLTPYEGERLRGRVKRTYVRGRLVYDNGQFSGDPAGQLLSRSNA
jgi:allantoinase